MVPQVRLETDRGDRLSRLSLFLYKEDQTRRPDPCWTGAEPAKTPPSLLHVPVARAEGLRLQKENGPVLHGTF